jgi:transposase
MMNETKTNETKSAKALTSGQRWNAARRREVVLRIFKGEPLAALSRELAVPLHKLERWRDKALAAMEAGLKERAADDPLQQEVDTAHRRIGELTMENELLRLRVEKTGPFPSRRSRR